MEEYASASHKSRAEENKKKLEKVVTGKVRTTKKSGLKSLKDTFISEDAGNVKSYIFLDVLVPAIKKAISDIVTNGTEMMLYGETKGRKSSNSSRISYRSYYEDDRRPRDRVLPRRPRFDEYAIESRGEAEDVLLTMEEAVEKYGEVSVAEYYELIGVTGEYTDNRYGWRDLRGCRVVPVREGYIVKLPPAVVLD